MTHTRTCTARRGASAPGRPRPTRLRPRAAAPGVSEAEGPPKADHVVAQRVVETTLLGRRQAVVELGSSSGEPVAPPAAASLSSVAGSTDDGGPVAAIRAFFLPTGWPHSVTPDYLNYQLATIPAHITGWMSHSLATSSMITALGVDAGPAAAVATTAAIKWIIKDGLGAAGRLIVGGRLSSVFDEDPKRWRMLAEATTTVGLALEIATQIYPSYFVALAGAGTLCKSMAKGMGTPCFRIIMTHFSATNNVGAVAAKEEVWEVAAQLLGLAASVAALSALEAAGSPDAVVPVWLAVHGAHVWLRYAALSALRFPYPNQKRAAAMALGHVRRNRVPSVEEGNLAERVLLPPSACQPRLTYGCTLGQALPDGSPGGTGGRAAQLAELVRLYGGEQYLLTWHGGAAWVLLLEGAQRTDLLRAMWQAAWLEAHHQQQQQQPAAGGNGAAPAVELPGGGLLAASLEAMRQRWPDFVRQAEQQGWQLERAVLPEGSVRLRLE